MRKQNAYGIIILMVKICTTASSVPDWSYRGQHGEQNWAKYYPLCGGALQSPININTKHLIYNPTLSRFKVKSCELSAHDQLTLSNNGHSVQLSLPSKMHLSGLPYRYSAVQLHLHWGSPSLPAGSEHTIDGRHFPAELHVVHYNSDKYPNVSVAADQRDGLAVLSVLIEVGTFSPAYHQFFGHFSGVRYKGQSTQIPGFNIRALLPTELDEYYYYHGSLTTPPCYQSVSWMVLRMPVTVSYTQFVELATTMFSSRQQEEVVLLDRNYRKTQNINNRIVFASFGKARCGKKKADASKKRISKTSSCKFHKSGSWTGEKSTQPV